MKKLGVLLALMSVSFFVFAADPVAPSTTTTADAIAQIINVLVSLTASASWSAKLVGFLGMATLIIGHASALSGVIRKIAGITPNTEIGKDANIVANSLSFLATVSSKIALHPKTETTKAA